MASVLADLTFSVTTPEGTEASGTLTSDGHTVTVRSDQLDVLAAGQGGGDLRRIADQAFGHGIVLDVGDSGGSLMRLGAVKRRFLHRLVTGSKHAQVVRWKAASALKAQVLTSGGETIAAPPAASLPSMPRAPWGRRVVTTTHDPYGGGHPRLYLSDTRVAAMNRTVGVIYLEPSVTTLGSGEQADLVLSGVDEVQATIERTPEDEYVLKARGTSVHTYVNGRELPEQTLRTGSRLEIGPWRLTYVRDEHADHGRPFGGRIGGELGYQRPQDKPRYQR